MDQSTVRFVRFIHGQLWTEEFGNPTHPLVLLIAGAEKQGIYWSSSSVDGSDAIPHVFLNRIHPKDPK